MSSQSVNPFIYGPPVPPEKFIGREREVDIILGRLANPYDRGGSTVSGPSGIGKTSLLHYLDSELAQQRSKELNPDIAHFVYIPLGFISPFSEIGFWEYLFDELVDWLGPTAETDRIVQSIEAGKSPSRFYVSKFFETLGRVKNKFTVVLLDGFDLLMSDINEDDAKGGIAFLQTLRALLNLPAPRGFSLITSSERDLFDLFDNVRWFGSAFYNNMANLPLGPFTDIQTETLLETYLSGTGVRFDENDLKYLKELSAGYPKKLQQEAYLLFEKKETKLVELTNQKGSKKPEPDIDFAKFDVFLAHNGQDKPQVEAIAKKLTERGLKPWLDKWHLPPGRPFAKEIERILPITEAAAVFVGPSGIGPWQDQEIYVILDLFAKEKGPVIPVLLPGIEKEPDLPLFLRQFSWVRFSKSVDEREALDNLEWGITGKHPRKDIVLDNLVETIMAAFKLLSEIARDAFEAIPSETVWPIGRPDKLKTILKQLDLEKQRNETDKINSFLAPLRQHKMNWQEYFQEEAKPDCLPVVKTALKQARENEMANLKTQGLLLQQHLEELTEQEIDLPGLE